MDASNHHAQPETLEAQLRRMLQTVPEAIHLPSRPPGQLPPTQPNHAAQRSSPAYPSRGAFHHRPVSAGLPTYQPREYQPQQQSFAPPPMRYQQSQQRSQHPQYHTQRTYGGPQYAYLPPPQTSYQVPLDPSAFNRRAPPYTQGQLFDPNALQSPPQVPFQQQQLAQAQYMESLIAAEVSQAEMSQAERDEKEAFRTALEKICHEVCESDLERLPKVAIESFGSFKSGFASAGSDLDLVIVLPDASRTSTCFSLFENDLPRVLEKRLLQLGYGARLLTRTRVPIIKVCEKPNSSFLDKLRQERERWDFLDNDKKYPHLRRDEDEPAEDDLGQAGENSVHTEPKTSSKDEAHGPLHDSANGANGAREQPSESQSSPRTSANGMTDGGYRPRRDEAQWTRERIAGPLDFPKSGVGIQSDINFFNPLGLHNTQLLRCYSLCDPRVRPMVLFVKAWAKRRKINSSYSGTLSSYGYVLMVLHYLVNVARPPVLPNLQMPWRPDAGFTQQGADRTEVDGCEVEFWRRDDEIAAAAQQGVLTRNHESLGSLLAGFFHYFSSQSGGASFHWMQQVLSLRTNGGLLTKEEKGWVKAVTEEGEGKKVQHRYLFCIEDPFELTHNVARTVTHMGLVAIRDEFRRANRILRAVGQGLEPRDGQLFDALVEHIPEKSGIRADGEARNEATNWQPDPILAQNQTSRLTNARRGGGPVHAQRQPPKPKPLDFSDHDAFPSLGAAKPAKKKRPAVKDADSCEISGERAKAYLEELKRKKAEEQAARTANATATAVLDGGR